MSKKTKYRELNTNEFNIRAGKYGHNPGIIVCGGFEYYFRVTRFLKIKKHYIRIFYCKMNQQGCKKSVRELLRSDKSSLSPRKFQISSHDHDHGSTNINSPPIIGSSFNSSNETESEKLDDSIFIIEFEKPHLEYNFPCSNITFSIKRDLLPFFKNKSLNNYFIFLRDRHGNSTTTRVLKENLIERSRKFVVCCHLGDIKILRGQVDIFSSFFLFGESKKLIFNPKRYTFFFQNTNPPKRNLTNLSSMDEDEEEEEEEEEEEFIANPPQHIRQSGPTRVVRRRTSLLKKRKRNDDQVAKSSELIGCHPSEGPLEGNQVVDLFFNIGMDSFFRRLLDCKNILSMCFFGTKRADVAEKALPYDDILFRKRGDRSFISRESELGVATFTIGVRTPSYERPEWVNVTLKSVGDLFTVTKENGYRYVDNGGGGFYTSSTQSLLEEDTTMREDDDLFDEVGNMNYLSGGYDDEKISPPGSLFSAFEDGDDNNYKLKKMISSLESLIEEENYETLFENEWEEIVDIFGSNLLFYLVAQNQIGVVRFLLQRRKDLIRCCKKDVLGNSLLDIARHFKHDEMVKLLSSGQGCHTIFSKFQES